MRRPSDHECDPYYTTYIEQVEGDDFLKVLIRSKDKTSKLLETIEPGRWDHRYAPGKWTVKELLIHMIDTERIFAYRALRIARNDKTPMAGFDQDEYVPTSGATDRSPASIINEYLAVRGATIELFKNFTDEMYARSGTASDRPFTPLALGFITAGHEIHHLRLLSEKYDIEVAG